MGPVLHRLTSSLADHPSLLPAVLIMTDSSACRRCHCMAGGLQPSVALTTVERWNIQTGPRRLRTQHGPKYIILSPSPSPCHTHIPSTGILRTYTYHAHTHAPYPNPLLLPFPILPHPALRLKGKKKKKNKTVSAWTRQSPSMSHGSLSRIG